MSVYDDFKNQTKTEPVPVAEPKPEPSFLDKASSFVSGIFKPTKDIPTTPEPKAIAPTVEPKSVYDTFKMSQPKEVSDKQPKSVYDLFKEATAPKTEPYFYSKTDNAGGAIGRSDELDVSGKPFLGYRNPGDTSTTTDKTRVATTFDPRVAQPLTKEQYYNPRAEGLRQTFKDAYGIEPSEQLDHAIALTVGGSNNASNLRAIPTAENQKAGDFEGHLAQLLKDGKISYFDAQVADAKQKGIKVPWTPLQEKAGLPKMFEDTWNKVKSLITPEVKASNTPTEPIDKNARPIDNIGELDIAGHKIVGTRNLRINELLNQHAQIGEAPKETIFGQIKKAISNVFTDNNEPQKDAVVMAIAKQTGQDPDIISSNLSDYTKALGLRDQPTAKEVSEALFTLPVVSGLVANPIATTLGIVGFMALTKAETTITGGKEISDVISDNLNLNEATRSALSIAELFAKGYALHGIYTKSPEIAKTFIKDVTTTYGIPKEVTISSDKIRDYISGRKINNDEATDLYKTLGRTPDQIKGDIKNGLTISLPIEKVITLTDKPYWAKIKGIFGVEPSSTILSQESTPQQEKLKQLPGYKVQDGQSKFNAGLSTQKIEPVGFGKEEKSVEEVKPTSAEIKPADETQFLAEEAKKYKSAEELVQVDKFGNTEVRNKGETQKLYEARLKEVARLQQYNNPTAHFRMVREEIKRASRDGITKLQFPTGETAMKIEGLGRFTQARWFQFGPRGNSAELAPAQLEKGKEISGNPNANDSQKWIITDVMGDGKFKAIQKNIYEQIQKGIYDDNAYSDSDEALANQSEAFDISGKMDTNNPIYKFYEKELGKYLTNKYDAKLVTDPQGVKWYEVSVKPEEAKKPVTAFKKPLFSKLSGPTVDIETAKKLLEEIIPKGAIRLAFRDELIDGVASGKFTDSVGLLKDILRPLIELYQEGGRVEVSTLYHEAGHYLFARLLTNKERIQAYEVARKNISVVDRAKYFITKYKGEANILEEYLMDEYAKQKTQEGGFKGPYKSIFERIDEILKNLIDISKKAFSAIRESLKGNKEPATANKYKRAGSPEEYDKPEKEKPYKYKNPIEEKINELKEAIQITQEALDANPAGTLSKYANRNGELPEVLGSGIGHGYFKTHGDDLVTELGFEDSETAREAYQNYKLQKKRLESQKLELKKVKLAYQNTKTLEKDAKSISTFLEKSLYKDKGKIANNAKENAKKPQESQLALQKRKQLAEKHLQTLIGATYNTTSPLERESSEHMLKLTQQAYSMSLGEFEKMNEDMSFKKIVSKFQTPVNRKVGIIDYLRTPDRVLRKIGLPNTMKLLRHSYESYLAELPLHIEVISSWAKRVDPKANEAIFNYLDGQTIKDHYGDKVHTKLAPNEMKVATEIKEYLANWADRLGLPEEDKISHYITHIFGLGENEKEFDEDLAKIITDKVTGSVYDPFLEKRLGKKGYLQDTWKALDAYVKRAVRKANMDPVLERLSEDANHLELSQMKYVKRLTDRVNLRPTEIDSAIDNTVKTWLGYKFGARPVAYMSRLARQTVFRYSLGANMGSALRNLTQGVNTYAKLGEKYTLKGYISLLSKGSQEELHDTGILGQDMIQDKKLSSTRKALEKVDKGLFFAFDLAEKINRGSAYFGAKAKGIDEGMSELEAVEYAKKIVRDTQFQFGSIDTPVGLNSDITKFLTQFLTYGEKQTEFASEMISNKEWAGIFRYIVASTAIVYLIGKVINVKWSDFVPGYSFLKFGGPPALALPMEIIKASLNVPDKFGNSRTLMQKITDVGNQVPFPAGVQIKKTVGGANAIMSTDPSKKIESNVYNYFKALVLGTQNIDTRRDVIKRIYDKAQQLKSNGKTAEADTLVGSLSDEDYVTYQKIKASDKAVQVKELKLKVKPIFDKAQSLKAQGKTEEADNLVKDLSDEEYKIYNSMKKLAGV